MKKRTVIVSVSLAILLAGGIAYAASGRTRNGELQKDHEPVMAPDEKKLEVEMIAALEDQDDLAVSLNAATAATTEVNTDKTESMKVVSKTEH